MRTTSGPEPIKWRRIPKRPDSRSARRLVPIVGTITALIAAIALANGGWGGSETAAAEDSLTAEIPRSRQGAQSAAARMAAALGREDIFNPAKRHKIINGIVEPERAEELQAEFDADYDPFVRRIGLTADGQPPAGGTFVSRTMPAGTTVRSYNLGEATVDVWCAGLFGVTGGNAKNIPVESSWFTLTLTLRWTDDGWRLRSFTQQDGPEPTSADAEFGEAPQM